jgi:inhibitor of KinA
MECVPASDASLLVVVADEIGDAATDRVIALFRALDAHAPPWLVNLHPAYTSLLVAFDPAQVDHVAVEQWVRSTRIEEQNIAGRIVDVVVSYDGVDLAFVAKHVGLSVDDVIVRHSAPIYRVAFLGFQPGFAYLLGLDRSLTVPRLDVPRPKVRGGSVAIGGEQTGIYPTDGPGGWRVIGHTDHVLDESWISPGDRVRFVRA